MDRFLMMVNVIMTVVLLLVITAALLGKLPGRLAYLAGVVITGTCLVAGLLRGDGFTIAMQFIAFTGWTCGLWARHVVARRQAAGTD